MPSTPGVQPTAGTSVGAPRPAPDSLQPWVASEVLDNSVRALSSNRPATLGIPLAAAVLFGGIGVLLGAVAFPGLFASDGGPSDGQVIVALVSYGLLGAVAGALFMLLTGLIGVAAIRAQFGTPVPTRTLIREVWACRAGLFAVAGMLLAVGVVVVLLAGLAMFGIVTVLGRTPAGLDLTGLLMYPLGLVVSGVLLLFSLSGVIVIVEGVKGPDMGIPVPVRVGAIGAVKRSWRMVWHQFWRCLGITILCGIVISLVVYALQLGIVALIAAVIGWTGTGEGLDLGRNAVIALASGAALVVTILVLSLQAAVFGLLYLDIRVRSEGLDIWLRAQQ